MKKVQIIKIKKVQQLLLIYKIKKTGNITYTMVMNIKKHQKMKNLHL